MSRRGGGGGVGGGGGDVLGPHPHQPELAEFASNFLFTNCLINGRRLFGMRLNSALLSHKRIDWLTWICLKPAVEEFGRSLEYDRSMDFLRERAQPEFFETILDYRIFFENEHR